MKAITKKQYREEYLPVMKKFSRLDPLEIEEVREKLSLLVGRKVRATDGGFRYEVLKSGIRYQGEKLGKSIWEGMIGWVCKPCELVDLIEELGAESPVEDALWVTGFADPC